jgi:hypothetical protein
MLMAMIALVAGEKSFLAVREDCTPISGSEAVGKR